MKNIFRIVFFPFFWGVVCYFLFRAFLCFSFCLFSILDTFYCEQSVSVFVGILKFCKLFRFFHKIRRSELLFFLSFVLLACFRGLFCIINEMITKMNLF